MWPFTKRGARVNTVDSVSPSSLDYAAFARNEACLKLWLPESITRALDRVSVAHDASRPDVLRALLFEHVYGRQELDGLIAWKRQQDAEARRALEADEGRMLREPQAEYGGIPERIASIELFGKATEDIKLWLPQLLKDDLGLLAKQERMRLSDYIRKALVRMLLGEKRHQQWRAAIGQVPADIHHVESDDGV